MPTARGRNLARVIPGAYDYMWQDLQRCVSLAGVPTDAMNSMYKQLVCHAGYGIVTAGGPTWDLEAWYEDVGWPTALDPRHQCHYPTNGNAAKAFDGSIVRWSDDPNPTSWLVVRDGDRRFRNHIPSGAVFSCLKSIGKAGPVALNAGFLDDVLPDQLGVQASCTVPVPSEQQPPTPQPPPERPPSGPAPAQPQPPTTRTIVVDNRVTNGSTQMREDDQPAYLSTVTRNYCKRDGCALPGTDMGSGAYLTAECTTFGDRTTNGQDNSTIDDGNPGLYSSTRWYGIRWGDGRFGYISEVWIRADLRGGLGLRGC